MIFSLQSGYVAEQWKKTLVQPLLKKCGLDLNFKNLCPVSNLFISKLTESAVAYQMQSHMSVNDLYPVFQSSYRKHSTKTALLEVHNDILVKMNKLHVALLVLLDLSAAFYTVNHDILLSHQQSKLRINGLVLWWFESYLCGRSQRVYVNASVSNIFNLDCGVSQGSCLGPLLFNSDVISSLMLLIVICLVFTPMLKIHSCIYHLALKVCLVRKQQLVQRNTVLRTLSVGCTPINRVETTI